MYDTNSLRQNVQAFSVKGQILIFLAFQAMWSQLFNSATVMQKQPAMDNMKMNGHGCVPINFFFFLTDRQDFVCGPQLSCLWHKGWGGRKESIIL